MDGVGTVEQFVALHGEQLRAAAVPPHFYPALCRKLLDQIFDAGDVFSLLAIDYEDEGRGPKDPPFALQAITDILVNDPRHIYLIDHAWTFRASNAQSQLLQNSDLISRIKGIAGLADDSDFKEVLSAVWRYSCCYWASVSQMEMRPEQQSPVWYIMDEVGSAMCHNDQPNFRAVPLAYAADSNVYTLIFPVRDVKAEEIISRDFVEGFVGNDVSRQAALLPWRDFEHYTENWYPEEPDKSYFSGGRMEENLPRIDSSIENGSNTLETPLKVFAQYVRVRENLTRSEFQITDDPEGADVLWLTEHFRDYRTLFENSPRVLINQFPFEHVITTKDLLAIVARRNVEEKFDENTLQTYPKWLPTTFNLKTELVEFISYYKKRESKNLKNVWICKPFNLARGLDSIITDDVNFIVRLPLTGPKIVQEYITDPVLFYRPDITEKVKFDIRYVILLKSVNPLRVYVYRNFFLRFANHPFSLDNFNDYEKHFTVMNYSNPANLFRMLCADFITEFNKQIVNHPWEEIEKNIFKMLKELFEGATSKPPPCGIANNKQSRALYAADIMLEWEDTEPKSITPKLLEINWMPDCDRACLYYPDFYNDIFGLLFLDQSPDSCIEI